jgi:hypothetical protein
MPELVEPDIVQLFGDCVCMYDGHPVRVIKAGRNMRIKNLEHGKEATVKFEFDKFKPLRSRLGFINFNGMVFYAARTPSRNFSVGLTQRNVKLDFLNHAAVNRNRMHENYDKVRKMTGKEWFDTIKGNYPSLQMALKIASTTNGSCAFDRQFAVDKDRNVYYKKVLVGNVPARARSINRIVFKDGYEHLELLLDMNYDKTVRIFGEKQG